MSGELHVFCGSWHVCPTCHEKKYISHPGEYAFKKHIMLKGHSVLALLFKESVSLEYAYIGMCIMLAAGLLHKEE